MPDAGRKARQGVSASLPAAALDGLSNELFASGGPWLLKAEIDLDQRMKPLKQIAVAAAGAPLIGKTNSDKLISSTPTTGSMMRPAPCIARLFPACLIFLAAAMTPPLLAENPAHHGADPPRADLLNFLFEKASALVGTHPTRYRNHISRSAKVELHEAVVRLDEGRVDLGPVFEGGGAGTYYLRWQPIAAADRSAQDQPVGPLAYAWSPSTRAPGASEGLRPGLYELSLMRRTDDGYRLAGADSAWVLIAGSGTYPADSAAFLDVQQEIHRHASLEKDEKKALLRAALDVLAQQAGK
jgi:hypothetical protein